MNWLRLILIPATIGILLLMALCFKGYNKTYLNNSIPTKVTAYKPDTLARINAHKSLKHIIDSIKISPSNVHILVIKSKYELSVWYGKTVLKNYPVALGINPKDDKLMQGDRCTPEGFFHIQAKYPSDKWTKFIWLDYPNAESWRKYKLAVKAGKIKKGTDIGGEVGIHGVTEGHDGSIGPGHNWTWGCVCLTHDDINELYNCVNSKTLVEIRKK